MTHGIKMTCLAVAFGLLSFVGTGCTSILHEDNERYAKKSREFQRLRQRLDGTYVGIETCKGTLCEIYQFESPFRSEYDPQLLEILIPVYGVSEKDPIQIYETRRRRSGDQPADLWLWDNPREVGTSSKGSSPRRRLDIVWTGGDACTLNRYVPKDSKVEFDQWQAELTIPWNKRSRVTYAIRNLGYVCTVPTDIVAGAGVVVVLGFVYCPCGMVMLIQALN